MHIQRRDTYAKKLAGYISSSFIEVFVVSKQNRITWSKDLRVDIEKHQREREPSPKYPNKTKSFSVKIS